jgi:hypothetical protein
MIANRPLQHGVASFHGVEHRALRDGRFDFDLNFVADVGEGAEMLRNFNADGGHGVLSSKRASRVE